MENPFVSIITDPAIRYPGSRHAFSPDTRYPEYAFDTVAPSENRVYSAVRDCLAQAGLDAGRFGTKSWNPLADFIPRGSRVFVLCNFVYHRRPSESVSDFHAKCVHGATLRAVLDYVLLAVGPEGRVAFGNAPVQSCRWDAVLSQTGAQSVLDFYQGRAKVTAEDLRLHVQGRGLAGTAERHVPGGVEIELGERSQLAQFHESSPARFRVSDYNPARTDIYQSPARHCYIVHPAILEANVIVSLSKLKMHEKVGITCGLKGFVGGIAHKDCLAHYRHGPPERGGDQYPHESKILGIIAGLHEWVYRMPPGTARRSLFQFIDRVLRTLAVRTGHPIGGSWSGNDTAWRMALDIAWTLYYADRQGRISQTQQRRHLSFVDGIVGGESNGPLSPRAVECGAVLFSNRVPHGDWAAARLMGFDPLAFPILRNATAVLGEGSVDPSADVWWNGQHCVLQDVCPGTGRRFDPPDKWRQYLAQHTISSESLFVQMAEKRS